jgi:hypothetical protein
MRMYRTVFVPALLYRTESLTILDKHKNRMQVSEMKYLRKVTENQLKECCKERGQLAEAAKEGLGSEWAVVPMMMMMMMTEKTRRDQIRNTKIRNKLKQESVEVLMEKRMLRWYGHAVRMDLERRPKLVLEARPEGGRGIGRPRLEWEEYVEGLARKRGRKLPEVKRLAQDRKEYRK